MTPTAEDRAVDLAAELDVINTIRVTPAHAIRANKIVGVVFRVAPAAIRRAMDAEAENVRLQKCCENIITTPICSYCGTAGEPSFDEEVNRQFAIGHMAVCRLHPIRKVEAERDRLLSVIREVHGEHADDLCWMDIDRIFAAAGLPIPDRKVGCKKAMLANCERFVDQMCEEGGWRSYADLEAENAWLHAEVKSLRSLPVKIRTTVDAPVFPVTEDS